MQVLIGIKVVEMKNTEYIRMYWYIYWMKLNVIYYIVKFNSFMESFFNECLKITYCFHETWYYIDF